MTKLNDLARLTALTEKPHTPLAAGTHEPIVRYTAEIPRSLHRSLKLFAVNEDTSTYAVTKALLALLISDEDVQKKVRGFLNG